MPFSSLGLHAGLLEAVRDLDYHAPTPIQAEAIPLALAGRDLVGCAQTGTGKTAAFVLPLLHRLNGRRSISALIVTPTRELARQIEEVARSCARYTKHRVAAVYGGVGYQPQVAALRRGVDLLVATPGRLLDLHNRGSVDLSGVEVLVLDEADRMLDMGFWPDVRRIISLLSAERQNLLFSATLSDEVMRVAGPILRDPARVEVAPSATPVESVTQAIYPVNAFQKTDLLVRLLDAQHLERVLVFTRTKHRADRLCRHLAKSRIRGAAIHSNRTQAQRQAALDGFRRGDYRVLVATDIVARGIDVDGISHVVNYDLPSNPEDYIHRIGRTARAGAEGAAFSFLSAEETKELRAIEVMLGMPLECRDLEGFDYVDRIVPHPDRSAVRKPRVVYRGRSSRRRSSARRVYTGAGWGS
ncbi:MAG: DEAD/DEAH box helicase [Actinobacteria bacterium]|nr:DEAD/DEAH box helicase [Actinomycetota bacterium]